MAASHPQLSSLFERALEMPMDRRAEFLDSVCAGDASLRAELASLLEAFESSTGYFETLATQLGVPALAAKLGARPSMDLPAYRIERELGGGGMSRVFLADEVALERQVVIKTLPQNVMAHVSVDRFRREITVIAQLHHPHIVPLLTANASDGLLYYTMPFVAGQSLRESLAARGALPLDEAIRVWRDVLDALAHAHARGIVHRDIKPANILLSRRNAMVTDFGIARAIEKAATGANPDATGPIGTPAYMAPEQAAGSTTVDYRADIYAAGLVMYEMLAGRQPFDADSARAIVDAHATRVPDPIRRPDVPAKLAGLVMQCLAKDPAVRPGSAEEILAQLDSFSSGPTWARALGQRPRTVALGTAGVVILVVAIAVQGVAGNSTPAVRHTPPDSAVRLYQRGMAEHRRRTIEGAVEALSLFERAIAVDSGYSLAWAAAARTAQFANIRGWTVAGRSADSLLALAVRASRRALELDSSSAEAWTVAGKVAGTVDLEDRAAAIRALNRAIALDSNYAEAWFELGLAHEEALHPTQAERSWRRAASLNPNDPQVLSFLAYHYMWYDDYAEGTRWADSAVTVNPTFFLARDAAVFLALAMHRPDVAMRHAEAMERTRGHEPPFPFCLLAAAVAQRGDLAQARRYALAAEPLVNKPRPSKHDVMYLATAWTAVGDTARAIKWLSAYVPRGDLHFQLHLKRDPALRWIRERQRSLLTPD